MPRLPRAVATAVTLTACVAATTTSCEPEGPPPVPRPGVLTEAELRSVLPSGTDIPGYVVKPHSPPTATPHTAIPSKVSPDTPQACQALVDFRLNHEPPRPAARVPAEIWPRDDTSGKRDFKKLHSVVLSSHTVEEASAVVDSLKKAVPLCGEFLVYTLNYGDQDARIRIGRRPAPPAGDDSVAFDWTVPGIAMNTTVPVTVVRTGGVLTAYSGAVPAKILRKQHEKLRAFISGQITRP
ncbi:hypothetical protein OOK31_36055 [Streptomyces sp. NBC_00249]|uniref:hypothetical protein n=1 Tax=Streptomyces sp. NBC_00249 TaxID=2975690 RepID=UPI0022557ACB|nr:hypothetical protein [Streptomyces sp. NBC_00249]MCX5199236.1 hypothetical protein [Streptomyces sp. NBC_00249]